MAWPRRKLSIPISPGQRSARLIVPVDISAAEFDRLTAALEAMRDAVVYRDKGYDVGTV